MTKPSTRVWTYLPGGEPKIAAVKIPNAHHGGPWWDAKGEAMVSTKRWPFAKTMRVSVGGCPTKRDAVSTVKAALRAILVTVLISLAFGCVGLAGHTDTPQSPEQSCVESCREYDDAYLTFYALGMVFSGTTAAAGTGGVLTATLADEPGADIGLAATAAASGIGAVVFNWLAGEQAERYTECRAACGVVE